MMEQSTNIASFISDVADKNYAAANQKLAAVVEAKLKQRIAKAKKKNLF